MRSMPRPFGYGYHLPNGEKPKGCGIVVNCVYLLMPLCAGSYLSAEF